MLGKKKPSDEHASAGISASDRHWGSTSRAGRRWKRGLKILGGVGLGLVLGLLGFWMFFLRVSFVALPELCSLPEEANTVQEYVLERMGGEISWTAVRKLRREFERVRDYVDYDFFHASTQYTVRTASQAKPDRKRFDLFDEEQVRIVVLRKRCMAADGVGYDVFIGAITGRGSGQARGSSSPLIGDFGDYGRAIFSQFFVDYRYEDILAGRRPFSFEKFSGSDEETSALITAETAGFTLSQLDVYMDRLGCVRSTAPYDVERFPAAYYYDVDMETYFQSRITMHDFSQKITVETNVDGTVQQVIVRRMLLTY